MHTFVHPEYNNRVDLVGTICAAQPQYYKVLQRIADDRAKVGARVHYEKVQRSPQAEWRRTPPAIQQKALSVRAVMEAVAGMLDGFGLVQQAQGMTFRRAWENHDTTELQAARLLNSVALNGLRVTTNMVATMLPHLEAQDQTRIIFNYLKRAGEEAQPESQAARLVTTDKDTSVVAHRLAIALEAVDQQLTSQPETDLVLLWGAGYLGHFSDSLTDRGFAKVDEQRLTAVQAL